MSKYNFPQCEKYQKVIDRIESKEKPVIVYGFGRIAKETICTLQERGIPIKAIIDKKKIQEQNYEGISIFNIDQWVDFESPILICSDVYLLEMEAYLNTRDAECFAPYYVIYAGRELNFLEYNRVSRLLAEWTYQEKLKNKKTTECILSGLDIVITESCSLKCKECSNLMQYFQKPKHSDYEETIAAVQKILSSIDYVKDINILGGEPFVNKDWYKYVLEVAKYENVGNILVHTNATIVPCEEGIQQIKDHRVVVKLSNYGPLSTKISALVELLEKYEVCHTVAESGDWIKCGDIIDRSYSEEQLKAVYQQCCMHGVLSLKDGKIYGCPFAGNAAALKAVPREVCEAIDVMNCEDIRAEIKTLQKKKYLKVCGYCAGRPVGVSNIPAAEQLTKPREYYKYE